jgi:hypothetical protein
MATRVVLAAALSSLARRSSLRVSMSRAMTKVGRGVLLAMMSAVLEK